MVKMERMEQQSSHLGLRRETSQTSGAHSGLLALTLGGGLVGHMMTWHSNVKEKDNGTFT